MYTRLLLSTARLSLSLLSVLPDLVTAQKVDLDRFHFEASYLKLPRIYVAPDSRTFGVRVSSSPIVRAVVPENAVYDQVNLSGYQKSEANPTVGVTVNFGDVRFEKTETLTRTEERKDKDGKVTGQTYYYSIRASYSAAGSYRISGPKAEETTTQPVVVEKPKEEKTNRFLAAANLTKTDESNAQKTVSNGFLSRTLTYTTKEYAVLTDASKYLEQNQLSIRTNLISDYVNQSIGSINDYLNNQYGYVPTKTREYLWILDSKKHPEYEVQQDAIKAVKELMNGMSATESLETLSQNLQPVMDYFQSLKAKYTGNEKPDRKMRYSAYYNLATLNYLLDRPARAIEEANGLVQNDYDTSDGKKYIELAEELQKDLDKHRMESRHINCKAGSYPASPSIVRADKESTDYTGYEPMVTKGLFAGDLLGCPDGKCPAIH